MREVEIIVNEDVEIISVNDFLHFLSSITIYQVQQILYLKVKN